MTIDIGFRRLGTAAAFFSLFCFAIEFAITPAALNEIARDYHTSKAVLGTLFFVQGAGFLLTVLIAGRISDVRGKFPVMLVGSAGMAVGLMLFAISDSLPLMFFAIGLMGIGGGLTEGVAMAAVSDLFSSRLRTAMLNLAQVMFAIGAVSSPMAIAKLISVGGDWRLGYLGAACLCAASTIWIFITTATKRENVIPHSPEHADWKELVRDPLVIALSFGILLYVGAENGQANWSAAYFRDSLGASPAFSASTVAVIWAGVGIGRLAAGWLSLHMSDISLVYYSLLIATALQAALLLINSPMIAVVVLFLLGFALAPVWPTILSRAGAAYPGQSGTVFGILITMGAIGSAIFPSTIGYAAAAVGMQKALWICFVLSAINLGIFLKLKRAE